MGFFAFCFGAAFYCDEVNIVFLPKLQVHEGFAVKTGGGFYAGKTVPGRKINLFANLGCDELIGPSLGGFHFRINHLVGADFGKHFARYHALSTCVYLLYAH